MSSSDSEVHMARPEGQPGKDSEKQLPLVQGERLSALNEVTWDGPDDPDNPLNWSTRRKVAILSLVSLIGFST